MSLSNLETTTDTRWVPRHYTDLGENHDIPAIVSFGKARRIVLYRIIRFDVYFQ